MNNAFRLALLAVLSLLTQVQTIAADAGKTYADVNFQLVLPEG